jgi:hypothetical protein
MSSSGRASTVRILSSASKAIIVFSTFATLVFLPQQNSSQVLAHSLAYPPALLIFVAVSGKRFAAP